MRLPAPNAAFSRITQQVFCFPLRGVLHTEPTSQETVSAHRTRTLAKNNPTPRTINTFKDTVVATEVVAVFEIEDINTDAMNGEAKMTIFSPN